jgi:FKBP-type peptidyl-prolyl cis-trans isomerase FklB
MNFCKLFLLFAFISFSQSITAQNNNSKDVKVLSENNPSDQFAFSYGLILGDNLKNYGIGLKFVSMDKILDGIRGIMDNNTSLTEGAAQKVVNEKLNEINKNKEAVKKGEKGLEFNLADLESFCFNYGVVIGANWKTFDILLEDVSLPDFQNGVAAMMLGNDPTLDEQAAQNVVSEKFQEMQRLKAEKQQSENDAFMSKIKNNKKVISLPSGVAYEVLTEGSGVQATSSNKVTTHYHGTLADGTVFDSSVDRGEPISFALNGVIKGWQEIIPLMKTGGKIKAYIPPHMAYGNRARGKIPANALLVFEIELISVE